MNRTKIILAIAAALVLQNCAQWENPEKSGADIIATPEGPWCEFNISEDQKWLQYVGDTFSDNENVSPQIATQQRRALFVNLETGEAYIPELEEEVKTMVDKGLGPDGIGCFSEDQKTVYYSQVVMKQRSSKRTQEVDPGETGSGTRLSAPSRSVERYFYKVALTENPLTVVKTNQAQCMEESEHRMPEIRVEQISDKEIQFFSPEGNLLVTHKPRGLLSSRITVFDPEGQQWEHSFFPAPNGNRIAYLVHEQGILGFAAPTSGYWLDVSNQEQEVPNFLGSSVYSFRWGDRETLYACTSHTDYRRAIVRWKF